MAKVYISAHEADRAADAARIFAARGVTVVSTWHMEGPLRPTCSFSESELAAIAGRDLNEIRSADCLVLLDSPGKVPGGKFVEAGFAIGLGKPVAAVGRRENMMMWCAAVSRFDTIAEAADWARNCQPAAEGRP